MKVRLKRHPPRLTEAEPKLSPEKEYHVIGIEADDFRIVDDEGDPVLFDARLFEIVDPTESDEWMTEFGEAGERYARPAELQRYIFEDFHDGIPEAVTAVRKYLRKIGIRTRRAPVARRRG
ncbi:MAG TPA: hypothetical protein VGM03_11245 [Phycisphaerae bacterium]|jgi:hypothetical protein